MQTLRVTARVFDSRRDVMGTSPQESPPASPNQTVHRYEEKGHAAAAATDEQRNHLAGRRVVPEGAREDGDAPAARRAARGPDRAAPQGAVGDQRVAGPDQ